MLFSDETKKFQKFLAADTEARLSSPLCVSALGIWRISSHEGPTVKNRNHSARALVDSGLKGTLLDPAGVFREAPCSVVIQQHGSKTHGSR